MKRVVVHRCGHRFVHALKAVHRVIPGAWEGGSLTAVWNVVRQMHTIGRMVVIYTTLGNVQYLLLWKYPCLISGTENSVWFLPSCGTSLGWLQLETEVKLSSRFIWVKLSFILFWWPSDWVAIVSMVALLHPLFLTFILWKKRRVIPLGSHCIFDPMPCVQVSRTTVATMDNRGYVATWWRNGSCSVRVICAEKIPPDSAKIFLFVIQMCPSLLDYIQTHHVTGSRLPEVCDCNTRSRPIAPGCISLA